MKKLKSLVMVAALFALPMSQASAFLVNIYSASPMTTLAQADAAIAAGNPTFTAQTSVIEFDDLGDGTRGLFSLNNAFPGGANNNFAARITGNFLIGFAETQHEAGLDGEASCLGTRQHCQAAGVAGAGAHGALQPGNGLDVVVEHIRATWACRQQHRQRRFIALRIGD